MTWISELTRPVSRRRPDQGLLVSSRSSQQKPENKTLVAILAALQLSAIVVVWLLAIVPAGLLALAVMARKAVAARFKKPPPR